MDDGVRLGLANNLPDEDSERSTPPQDAGEAAHGWYDNTPIRFTMATKIVISETPPPRPRRPNARGEGGRRGGSKSVDRAVPVLPHAHGSGEGHRIAHCHRQTPYTATGYNLALADVSRRR